MPQGRNVLFQLLLARVARRVSHSKRTDIWCTHAHAKVPDYSSGGRGLHAMSKSAVLIRTRQLNRTSFRARER